MHGLHLIVDGDTVQTFALKQATTKRAVQSTFDYRMKANKKVSDDDQNARHTNSEQFFLLPGPRRKGLLVYY